MATRTLRDGTQELELGDTIDESVTFDVTPGGSGYVYVPCANCGGTGSTSMTRDQLRELRDYLVATITD